MNKLNRGFKSFFFILIATLIVSCSGGSDSVELKLNLEKGKKYYYSFETNQDIRQEMMGDTIDFKQAMTWGYELEVLDVSDEGIMTIKTTYSHIKMSNDNQVFNLSYDSKEPLDTSNMFAVVMNTFINKSFTMNVNPEGIVSNVEGFNAIFNSIVDEMGEDGELIIQNLESQFSEASVSENLEQGFRIFPDINPVKVGDIWTVLNIINGPLSMDIENTYQLKSIKGGKATITITSTIKHDDDIAGIAMLPGAEISIEGSQEGTIEIDIATGMVLKSDIKQDISQLIKAQGMEIPITINSKMEITGKKL